MQMTGRTNTASLTTPGKVGDGKMKKERKSKGVNQKENLAGGGQTQDQAALSLKKEENARKKIVSRTS